MRVAVSGTHCAGKSTLIEEFLLAHPEFGHEPEPYMVLTEDYGEVFAARPSAEDFYRQLEFNVDRLRHYEAGDLVIFERCPVDFLAYMLALTDLGRDAYATGVIENSLRIVTAALELLDLIVFLPLNGVFTSVASDVEELELRTVVDDRLAGLLRDDDLNLFTSSHPQVVEVNGSTAMRLEMVERALLTKPTNG